MAPSPIFIGGSGNGIGKISVSKSSKEQGQFRPYRRNSRVGHRGLIKLHLAALIFGLLTISGGATTAMGGNGRAPCGIVHQFKPGPIVNGHTRQPTQGEFETRMRQLQAWSTANVGSCVAESP